jgi:hypothetical protein
VPGLVRAPAATLGGVERNLGAEAAAVEELIRRKREDFFQTQQDIREFLDEQR